MFWMNLRPFAGALVAFVFSLSVHGVHPVNKLAAGQRHACAIIQGGYVQCWGQNSYGQVGDGTIGNTRLSPVNVVGINSAISITAGSAHTCALLADHSLKCWGRNDNKQIGDGTNIDRPTPTTVMSLSSVEAVAAGGSHTCALRSDGAVHCWGLNNIGQIGVPFADNLHYPPTQVLSGATAISAGAVHSCALLSGGDVKCWGANNQGQVGIGAINIIGSFLPSVGNALLGGPAVELYGSSQSLHACAKLSDGKVQCWGENNRGQLGREVVPNSAEEINSFPFPTPGDVLANATTSLSGVVSMSLWWRNTCALIANSVKCWGDNSIGQLGIAAPYSGLPGGVLATDVVEIANQLLSSCMMFSNGSVSCWGEGGYLGNGGTVGSSPTPPADARVITFRPVIDTVSPPVVLPPTVRLANGAQGYLIAATSAAGALNFSGGTVVDFDNASFHDPYKTVPVSCKAADGTTFPFGASSKIIECSATDAQGNTGTITSSAPVAVFVQDTGPNIIVADIEKIISSNFSNDKMVVNYTVPLAHDAVDGLDYATLCSPASGQEFYIGSTKVTCEATDSLGNTSSKYFNIFVLGFPPKTEIPCHECSSTSGVQPGYFAYPAGVSGGFILRTENNRPEEHSPLICTCSAGSSPRNCAEGILELGINQTKRVTCSLTGEDSTVHSTGVAVINVFLEDLISPELDISIALTGPDSISPSAGLLNVISVDQTASLESEVCTAVDNNGRDRDVDDEVDANAKTQECAMIFSDSSYNKTKLVIQKRQSGNHFSASLISIQYWSFKDEEFGQYPNPIQLSGQNSISFNWSLEKSGKIKELKQTMTIGKAKEKTKVTAKYKSTKTEITKIRENLPKGQDDIRSEDSGLILLHLVTNQGELKITH